MDCSTKRGEKMKRVRKDEKTVIKLKILSKKGEKSFH
jgi:hypothetical protein